MTTFQVQNPFGSSASSREFAGSQRETEHPVDPRSDKPKASSGRRRIIGERRRAERPYGALPKLPLVDHLQAPDERRQGPGDLERSHRDLQKIVAAFDNMREEEQRRLAHDMHDDLGQLLGAMKIELALLKRRLPAQGPEQLQPIHNLNELVDTMVVSVRRIIADLPPKVLEDHGLFCALEMLVTSFRKRHMIETFLERPVGEPVLPDNMLTPIYRMVQEALNNIGKHAHATKASVKIAWRNQLLQLTIADNGTGLPPGSQQKHDSFGLIGMRQRAAALGGKFSISNIKGSGAEIQIVIPLGGTPLGGTPLAGASARA